MGRFLFLMIKKEDTKKGRSADIWEAVGTGHFSINKKVKDTSLSCRFSVWVAVLGHVVSVALQEARGPWQLQSSVPSGPLGRAGSLPPGCRVHRGGPVLAQKPS